MLFGLLAAGILLAGCNKVTGTPLPASPNPSDTPQSIHTPTQSPPTPTSQPLAAVVNGEEITLAEYEEELARYQAEVGTQMATEEGQRVLEDLIDQVLLTQAAKKAGYEVDEGKLQERISRLVDRLGSVQALEAWIAAQGYTRESFERSLARSIAAAWMRDRIIQDLPETAEQVHARQILLYTAEQADQVFADLRAGQDFTALAARYDPLTQGDLGWFPRGYLLDARLEEAAFDLEVGQYSQVIETAAGFHILQVIERDPQRPLEPDARLVLQMETLKAWLEAARSQSEIQILVP